MTEKWLRAASEQGHGTAQMNLALLSLGISWEVDLKLREQNITCNKCRGRICNKFNPPSLKNHLFFFFLGGGL